MNKQELIGKIKSAETLYLSLTPFIGKKLILDLVKQLDEPQKVQVPQFVADWIEVCKEHLTSSLYLGMTPSFLKANNQGIELTIWIKKNEETFALAWINGYEVEKEKRYLVKVKGVTDQTRTLKRNIDIETWYFGNPTNYEDINAHHTRKELEEAGFGWVFDCPGMEVEEVE